MAHLVLWRSRELYIWSLPTCMRTINVHKLGVSNVQDTWFRHKV